MATEDTKASYGFVALLAKNIPEIASILQQATSQGWTTDRFIMAVADTNWWKNTNDPARQWAVKLAGDPKTAQVEMDTGAESLRQLARNLGVYIPNHDEAAQLWLRSKMEGQDENATRSMVFVFGQGRTDTNQAGGVYGKLVMDMRQMAYDYGYTSGDLDNQITQMAFNTLSAGGASTEEWKMKLQNYAQVKYAPYAEDIRGGRTVSDIAKPEVESVAQLLEQNPEALSLNDSLISKALTQYNDQGKAYSLSEIQRLTRQDQRWDSTQNAKDQTAKLLNEIGQRMGFIGG